MLVNREQFVVSPGSIAFHKAGEDPMYVISVGHGEAQVRRPVRTQENGLQYRTEAYPVTELETRHQRAVNEGDFMAFLLELGKPPERTRLN